MDLPLQVTFEGLEPTDAIRSHIETHCEKLGRLGRCVTHVRVAVGVPHRHSWKHAEYRVRVELKLPHKKPIVVRSIRSDDLYSCISEAFAAAARTLVSSESRDRARRRESFVAA